MKKSKEDYIVDVALFTLAACIAIAVVLFASTLLMQIFGQ